MGACLCGRSENSQKQVNTEEDVDTRAEKLENATVITFDFNASPIDQDGYIELNCSIDEWKGTINYQVATTKQTLVIVI